MTLYDLTSRQVTTLVDFRWGAQREPRGEYQAYTDGELPENLGGLKYVPTPSMEVELPALTLDMQTEEGRVSLPNEGWAAEISQGIPHAQVICRVSILIRAPESDFPVVLPGSVDDRVSERDWLFGGPLLIAQRETPARPGMVDITVGSPKEFLRDKTLGIAANAECGNSFMGAGCLLATAGKSVPSTIQSIDGPKVTTAPTGVSSQLPTFWDSGFLHRKGLMIKIRSWTPGTADFILSDQPPGEWLGNTIDVVAGCDRKLTKCRFWNNEPQFGAYGWAIPGFNPLYQVP